MGSDPSSPHDWPAAPLPCSHGFLRTRARHCLRLTHGRRHLMNLLRRISTPKLIAVLVLPAVAVLITAVAVAPTRSGPKPPARSLASALNSALHAKPVAGFSARVTFTNHLFPAGALTGSPLLAGASGRVWISNDGRFRLELQSDTGDTQITGDGSAITMYDAAKGTLYRFALPAAHKADAASNGDSAAKKPHAFGIS